MDLPNAYTNITPMYPNPTALDVIGLTPTTHYIGDLTGHEDGETGRMLIHVDRGNGPRGMFDQGPYSKNWIMFAGHNFYTSKTKATLRTQNGDVIEPTEWINFSPSDGYFGSGNNYCNAERDGFSFAHLEVDDEFHYATDKWIDIRFQSSSVDGYEHLLYLGGLSMGRYYDMPTSPEIELTMTHLYDGITPQKTKGGAVLPLSKYKGSQKWVPNLANFELGAGPWEFPGWGGVTGGLNPGRRVWDLKFKYLSDSDLEPVHYNVDDRQNHSSWNEEGNWFSSVLFYTMGGALPFVFCPNPGDEYNPYLYKQPELAICRFNMNTFQRKRITKTLYDISVKIEETW
jgi:hypothetical protein